MKTFFKLVPFFFSSLAHSDTLSLDKMVSDSLAFWKVPGCTVSIVQGDEILLCKGYGVKQVGGNSVDIHTRFPIASLTKLFTAVSVGILVDQGRLTFDTPILHFYPQLKLSDEYARTHLTLRDCLSMRSGLPGPSVNHILYANPDATQQHLLEKVLPTLPFPLGFRSHFAYQNLLFLLAATPFNSYESFLQNKLLSPLEMKETLTSYSALQSCTNKAYPHLWKENRFEQIPFENTDAELPAGGLSSSANDMTHFLSLLLHQGTFHAKSILSPSTLSEIFSPQTVATAEEFTGQSSSKLVLFPNSQFLTYGLGCFLYDYCGIKIIQVPGRTDGTNSVLAIIPSQNLGIFIATNSERHYFTYALLFQIIDSFLNQNKDWNNQFLKQ